MARFEKSVRPPHDLWTRSDLRCSSFPAPIVLPIPAVSTARDQATVATFQAGKPIPSILVLRWDWVSLVHPIGRAVRERSKRERDREGKIVSRGHLGGCGYRRPHRLPEKSLPGSWPATFSAKLQKIVTRFRRDVRKPDFHFLRARQRSRNHREPLHHHRRD